MLIKWVGSKRRLLPELEKLFPKNFKDYHEPFLGSGAVFFHLKPERALLLDTNKELIHFYRVVRAFPEELMKKVDEFKVDEETYYYVRSLNPKNLDPITRAARFLYLNKTAYNGLWRVNAKGEFNVPFGKYKKVKFYDRDKLLEASELLKKATLLAEDFSLVLEFAEKGDFVYLDPPYYGNFSRYTDNDFTEEDHVRLSQVFKELDKIGCFVMLSNSNDLFIRSLYDGYRIIEIQAPKSVSCKADGRKPVKEIVVVNY